jgi:ABC-2 type transport system permease protein
LRVPTWMMMLSLATVFLMTFGITAICVGVGALYPKFTFDHAAEIPTSFGGAICMIVSIAFVGAAVMIEAWPIYLLAMRGLNPGGSTVPEFWVLAPSLSGVIVLTLAAAITSIRLGLKSLERLKD